MIGRLSLKRNRKKLSLASCGSEDRCNQPPGIKACAKCGVRNGNLKMSGVVKKRKESKAFQIRDMKPTKFSQMSTKILHDAFSNYFEVGII